MFRGRLTDGDTHAWHEGHYALANILGGVRAAERNAGP
jgi:hypothetical protein